MSDFVAENFAEKIVLFVFFHAKIVSIEYLIFNLNCLYLKCTWEEQIQTETIIEAKPKPNKNIWPSELT